MKLSLQTEGLFNPGQFQAWSAERRKAIRESVAHGMRAGGQALAEAARTEMRRAFHVKRVSFVRSMRAKLYDDRKDRLPALLIGSKIPWLGIHAQGGTVSGNLLIPLLPTRIGPKRFRAVIEGLLLSGNAYFVRKNGKAILMAENIKENSRELARFKRAERQRTGVKRLQRGQEIPIALLVKSVQLRKRLDLEGTVRRGLPRLAAAIQTALNRSRD